MCCVVYVYVLQRGAILYFMKHIKKGGVDDIIYSLTVEPLSEFNLAIILDTRSAEPMM